MTTRLFGNDHLFRRCTMLFLTLTFITSMNAASLRGDVNNDREVNIEDISIMTSYILADGQGTQPANADLNGDGILDINDVLLLVELILEGEKGPDGNGGEANPNYPVLSPMNNDI